MGAVSSIHLNVSRALRMRMPAKPKKTLVPEPPQPPTKTVIDIAPPMANGPTADIDSNRGAADPTETRGSY